MTTARVRCGKDHGLHRASRTRGAPGELEPPRFCASHSSRGEDRGGATAGYSYVAHDVEAGFHSTAVPLRRWDGTAVAALNVGASVERTSELEMQERVLPALRETAEKLRPQLV